MIRNLQQSDRRMIREAAALAMDYWPNAHLGDYSRREDLRSAFTIIRRRVEIGGESVHAAAAHVQISAFSHRDM